MVNSKTRYRVWRRIFVVWLLFLIIPLVHVQYVSAGKNNSSPDSVCTQTVRSIYKKMNSVDHAATGNSIYYMNYSIKTTLHKEEAGENNVSTSDIEVMIGKNQVRYLSKELSVYEDNKNSFTVIPSRKIIYRGDPALKTREQKASREKSMMVLQDTLFDLCTLKECKKIAGGKEVYDEVITLEAGKEAQKLFGLSAVTFYISTSTMEIKKVLLEYPGQNNIQSVELVYNSINYNYKKEDFEKSVKSFFINDKQQLKEAYKNYQLVDNRKNK